MPGMAEFFSHPPPQLWAFVLASLLIELTPGPNMTWLAMMAVVEGRLRGYAAVAGIALGLALLGAAAAIGLAEIVRTSKTLYEVLRWAGVAFLLYLAYDGWRGEAAAAQEGIAAGLGRAFLRGLMTNLLNPKAAIFYIAVLPAFVAKDLPPAPQIGALTLAYVGVATAVHAGIVTLCGTLQNLTRASGRERLVRRGLSLALAGVALWFAWSTAA